MFLGHFAVAFAAKRVAPAVSLGTLFLAAQLADLIWPNLFLLGVERFEVRPGITVVARRRSLRAAAILLALVLSHWLLDVASHRPDVPLTLTGPERFGLGLWNSTAATVAVEFALLAAGVAAYARLTRPLDRVGRWALIGLVAFLVAIYLATLFGPPPGAAAEVAWSAQAMWLLVAWGYWIDRHRAGR